tara:strand:- start:1858 stop:2655 length:798 start_codon:yes stop_codon:yes gene_type:complete
MNEFPNFHPNDPALNQLSSSRMNKISGGQKSNQIQPGAGYRVVQTSGGTTVSAIRKRQQSPIPPRFWPTLITGEGGESFKFTITDGYVADFHGGNANSDAFDIYYPTGIGTFGGERTETSISVGQQITIGVTVDKNGGVTAASVSVQTEDINSLNPDPTYSSGYGSGGVYYFKIAVLKPAVGDAGAYLEYHLAGSHILLRHRGHNLDQHVFVVDISNGAVQAVSDHYLCWRNGDYVGKFESTDTLPDYLGSLDTDSVTYLQEFYP